MSEFGGKEIVYTRHADQRVKGRFILKKDIEEAILNEKWEETYGNKSKVIHKINGKEIEVILKPEDNKILVITVYWR